MRQPQETSGVARAHLQFSGSQHANGASSRSGCPPVFFVGLLAKSRVGANCPRRGTRQLHVVHDAGLAGIVDEQFQRLSDAAPSLVDGATLCVAAADTAHGGDPPARLVSLEGHAIRLHGFFNHPFPRPASARRALRASYGEVSPKRQLYACPEGGYGSKSRSIRRARCLHTHEPVRSSHIGRIRCVDASLVAGSRRNRRTSGCAEGPSRSRNQVSRWLPDVSRTIDRCRLGAPAAGSAADVVWFGTSPRCTHNPTHWRTATTHNARHQRAPNSQCLFASVPKFVGLAS